MKRPSLGVKLVIVVVLVLFSVTGHAGWRQEPENGATVEKTGDNSGIQRPQKKSNNDSGYRQDQQRGNDRYLGNLGPATKTVTKPGFRRDDSRYQAEQRNSSFELDKRYHHHRYYPRQGTRVTALPRGYRTVPWHGTRYYFFGGSWYLSSSSGFLVALPPVGLLVPFLPSFYTTIWVGGIPYYYAGGVYYIWEPAEQSYRVTTAPPEQEVVEGDPLPQRLFIYPVQGQSEQQQAKDRYECHSWAKSQADFDPTLPTDDIPAAEISQRGADYNRAMKACLTARGYSVE